MPNKYENSQKVAKIAIYLRFWAKHSGYFVDNAKTTEALARDQLTMDGCGLKKRKRESVENQETKQTKSKLENLAKMSKIQIISSTPYDSQVCEALSDTLEDQEVKIEVTDCPQGENVICFVTLNPNFEVIFTIFFLSF